MTFYIGITTIHRTCPNTGEVVGYAYLDRTLRSLLSSSNTDDVRVFVFPSNRSHQADLFEMLKGITEDTGVDASAHWPDEDIRLFQNSNRMLRELCLAADGPFLALQDDQKFCRRALDRIRDVATEVDGKVAMCSFYTPWAVPRQQLMPQRVGPYPSRDVYGTLCMLWNPIAAISFLNSDGVKAHTGWKGWDMVIKRWLVKSRWTAVRHVPCLAQHTGVVSAAHHKWNKDRTTKNYLGDKFDAMSELAQ